MSRSTEGEPLVRVAGLRVELEGGADVVDDVAFDLAPGEILGIVGESGSGKTTIAGALLGHARAGARITHGFVQVGGTQLVPATPELLARARGALVSYVAQDPGAALDPLMRIGAQLREVLDVHAPTLTPASRNERCARVLGDVGLPTDRAFLRRFAHQLSGGQAQRLLLALALVTDPTLVVLDEPTTALDVTSRALVLDTIRRTCRGQRRAAVYVSHELPVVQAVADRVLVLYGGRVVERGATATVFARPAHPYTRALLGAVPQVGARASLVAIPGRGFGPRHRPQGCGFAARCALTTDECRRDPPPLATLAEDHAAACFIASPTSLVRALPPAGIAPPRSRSLLEARSLRASYGARQVLHDVSFAVPEGACVALVGASGSGKTTIARAIAGLGDRVGGELAFDGAPLPLPLADRGSTLRSHIQYVFQNPYRSLNPRRNVAQAIGVALDAFFHLDRATRARRIDELLERVSLDGSLRSARPQDLSGGERQRVALARALAARPRLLVCDEITSALDVSVQASIIGLLQSLQSDGLSLLFVTHDLALVSAIADEILLLEDGRVTKREASEDVVRALARGH